MARRSGKVAKADNVTNRSDSRLNVGQNVDTGAVLDRTAQLNPERKHEANSVFWEGLGYRDIPSVRGKRKVANSSASNQWMAADRGSIDEKYSLRINSPSKRVLLLQYPDRAFGHLYCNELKQKPVEIRVKPKSGVVEVDVPLPTEVNFDQERGIDFSIALQKSNRKNGAHGLAGGLGVGSGRSSKEVENLKSDPDKAGLLSNYETAVMDGHVMDRITLGGRIVPAQENDPIYMVTTFEGTTCTWTKVDAIVQLRTQFHHLDALNEESHRATARLDRRSGDQVPEDRVQDVNMYIKDTGDPDQADMYGGMNETARVLRNMRDEPWQRMKWNDSTDNASYDAFDQILVSEGPGSTPFLVSDMSNDQYLDAISCSHIDPNLPGKSSNGSLENGESPQEDSSSISSSNSESAGGDEHDSPTESNGVEAQPTYEMLPTGAVQPDGATERDVERICRLICLSSPQVSTKVEQRLRNRLKDKPRFAFLGSGHVFHSYFKWRLERNRLGDGIEPKYDYGGGQGLQIDIEADL